MRRRRLHEGVLAVPAAVWLLAFFVAPVALVVWYSVGYEPGLSGTHANDMLSLGRYGPALDATFAATYLQTLQIALVGTLVALVVLGAERGSMVGQLVASQFQSAQNGAPGSAMAVLLVLTILVTVGAALLSVLAVRSVVRANRSVRLPRAAAVAWRALPGRAGRRDGARWWTAAARSGGSWASCSCPSW